MHGNIILQPQPTNEPNEPNDPLNWFEDHIPNDLVYSLYSSNKGRFFGSTTRSI